MTDAAEPKERKVRAGTKQAQRIEMLRSPEGASIAEIVAATNWKSHTARGAKRSLGWRLPPRRSRIGGACTGSRRPDAYFLNAVPSLRRYRAAANRASEVKSENRLRELSLSRIYFREYNSGVAAAVRLHGSGGKYINPENLMNTLLMLASAGTALLIATAGVAQAADVTEEELLKRLEGVAPADVLGNATLLHITAGGEMQTVREGTNGWACMYPGTDPMCVDAGGLKWMHALMEGGKDAPQDLGFVYMLLGDEGTSNIAPGAKEETPDNAWVQTGPHVMIVGAAAKPMMQDYPREAKADPSKPFVMWPETPYEHLMLPVE